MAFFAIAMTLLVLELKAPDLPKHATSAELLQGLGQQIPAFFSFLASFLYCGVMWLLHHLAFHFIRRLQAGLVWLNLLFLMSISIFPFSCAILGHFIRNSAAQEIYLGNMFLASSLLALQWWVARRKKLINDDDRLAVQAMQQRLLALPAASAAGMLATLDRPTAGFYAMIVVLLLARIWQRRRLNKELRTPAPSPSAS